MGYVTNQWVNTGEQIRNRPWKPVPVEIVAEPARGAWSHHHGISVEFEAADENDRFQQVYLTADETERAAFVILRALPSAARRKLVLELLVELSQTELAKVLAEGLKRARAQKQASGA